MGAETGCLMPLAEEISWAASVFRMHDCRISWDRREKPGSFGLNRHQLRRRGSRRTYWNIQVKASDRRVHLDGDGQRHDPGYLYLPLS
jgi:hypothetical protein